MKRYINVDKFELPCTAGDCYECIFFSLNRCIMKDHINNAATENVIEVTDKSMESLVKGLEILGNTEIGINFNCADVVEVVRCKDCVYRVIKRDPSRTPMDCFGCNIMHYNEDDWYCSFGERKSDG